MGNTFDVNTVKYGHARKVWREIRHRYPGGGMVSNISDWVAVGKIPAGTAVKFDLSGKTFKAYTDEQIKAAESDITTLGINGYLQEDAWAIIAATVKAYGLTFEEVLYNMSYPNLILYNAVLPSYNTKDKSDGSGSGQEVIKADDPRNKERVKQFFDSIE